MISNLTFGGAERQVVEIANELNSDEFEVHICILSDLAPLADRLRYPERLHKLPKKSRFDLGVVWQLYRLIRELKIDVVHGFLFDAEIASRLAGRLANTFVIGSERNSEYVYPKLHYWMYRLTNSLVDVCVANSEAGKRLNQSTFRLQDEHYRVIRNGVDTRRFAPSEGSYSECGITKPETRFVLGMVGSFKKQKNHMYLLEIVDRLRQQRSDFTVLVVGAKILEGDKDGEAYFKEILAKIEALNLQEVVRLVGAVEKVDQFYPLCDLTVLTSKHEGTPNVALESMACAVPVVATDVADNAYVIPNDTAGYVVSGNDADEFARTISAILDDPGLRARLSKGARDWIMAEFTSGKLAERYEKLYGTTE